ncbi:MAG: hypothetical protein JXA99_15380 [Candidatus Lokiarchaeota archaeon]|nr:hypothetical protein [Candidatus Lokiarchaeota archaeon]
MINLEEQYQKILERFPNAILVNDYIFHMRIPFKKDVFLDINFFNYPKKPTVSLMNIKGQSFDNLEMMVSSLKNWKKKNPIDIIELIIEVQKIFEHLQTNEVLIKSELINGILGLCKDQHPKEMLGLLRMEKGIISEFILPPGVLRSTNNTIFNPSRMPLDTSIIGSVHSHPSGNPIPSFADLKVFRNGYIHFIVGYPYDYSSIKCYDQIGNKINFKLVD